MTDDPAGHVELALHISRQAFAHGRVQAAYYAVNTALFCARDTGNRALVGTVRAQLLSQVMAFRENSRMADNDLDEIVRGTLLALRESALIRADAMLTRLDRVAA